MATVGHTLVGLSLTALPGPDSQRDRRLWMVWPGLLVLLAHLVDLVEWGIIVAAPTLFDAHFVSNSLWLALGLAAVVSLTVFAVARRRRGWVLLIAAAAILSHVVMDVCAVRVWVVRGSELTESPDSPGLGPLVIADLWFYGLVLIVMWSLKAARQPAAPAKGRWLAMALLGLGVTAAATRIPAFWGTAYVLAAGHALLMLRRELSLSRWWSVMPVLPLLGLLTVELWAAHLQAAADERVEVGDFAGAVPIYRRIIEIPTRSPKLDAWLKLSHCQVQMREVFAAEKSLRRASALAERPWIARYWLAVLYAHEYAKGTDLYRPTEAAAILEELIDGPYDEGLKSSARSRLDRLRSQGIVP